MILKNVPLTLLKVQLKEGVGKASGKAYKFYTAQVVDEDANVFGLNVADSLANDKDALEELLEMKNSRIDATIEFKPKGFDIGGSLTAIR